MASLAGAQWVNNIGEVKALLAMDNRVDPADALAELGIDATRAYNYKEAVIVWGIQQTARGMDRGMHECRLPGSGLDRILDDFKTAFGAKVNAAVERSGRPSSPMKSPIWCCSSPPTRAAGSRAASSRSMAASTPSASPLLWNWAEP